MKLMLKLAVPGVAVLSLVVACSSDDDSSGSPRGEESAACSCAIDYNGASRTLDCGTTACLASISFACSENAEITQGAACVEDAGTATSDAGSTAAPGPFDCYGDPCDSAKSYCILSKVASVTASSSCVPLPASCTSCECASADAEAAWKAANNGTNNCTGATLLCESSGRGVTVTCQKRSAF